MVKSIVTARLVTDNQQIFIKCNTVSEALNIQNKLLNIELKEHTYKNISLRSSKPSLKKYKDLTSLFLSVGA